MMSGKNLLRAVIGIFIGGALLTMTITYQVQFTDSAVVETLGKPTGEPMGAGLHPRWPWPIQRVITYDMRVQHFEGVYEQMQTKDGKNVLVSVFVCWRVADPLLFRQAVSDKLSEGETFIQQKVRDATLQVVGNYPMDAFASRQEGAVKLKEMEKRILEQTRPLAISQYGVDVLRVGIKRLSLPEDVTTVVMENM
ncbi:MAG: hypothetical protein HQ546_01385, partial [Planctomycetes bacterium]|nr:hypothetical protein [Planctomycetota bacterium]